MVSENNIWNNLKKIQWWKRKLYWSVRVHNCNEHYRAGVKASSWGSIQ